MSRNADQWRSTPKFPSTHYVHTGVYTDEAIFKEEQDRIFNQSWIIACHESELSGAFDYRTFQHPGGAPLIIVRGDDGVVRSFYNICPHRGNTLLYTPSGNARSIRCIFHSWAFDSRGQCINISRGKQGYQDRFGAADAGLREVRTSIGYGGFVWVCVDDSAPALTDFIGEAMSSLGDYLDMPLEVFHYHQAVVNTNYKLWHDTNSEFYHDYMHYFNRITGMQQPGYFERKYTGYPNGHAAVGSMSVKYDAYEGSKARGVGWPGLAPGGWVLIDIFPGMTYNLRTSVLRMDTAIPLGAGKVLIEFRGLAPKADTPEERAERVRDHNQIWGPFGRNLHEDLLGVHGQGLAMRERTDSRWVLHGREENMTIHDEGGMRHFYAEWSRRMGRSSSDPYAAGVSSPASTDVPAEVST
jgi:methanesulfonate monooxygenase large subunit